MNLFKDNVKVYKCQMQLHYKHMINTCFLLLLT